VWFITLVFGGVLAVVAASKWWTPQERVPWGEDFPAAAAQARAANRPVVLYFTASWCEPCQWMRRYVWTDRGVADAMKAFVPVRIDIDRDPATSIRFHVGPIPSFFLLTPDGQVVRSHEGAMDPQEFTAWLSSTGGGVGGG
jgi:thiol:disulfide interchange protein